MFDSKNVLYILTMLEAIEKIFIYSADFEDEEKFYFAEPLADSHKKPII